MVGSLVGKDGCKGAESAKVLLECRKKTTNQICGPFNSPTLGVWGHVIFG